MTVSSQARTAYAAAAPTRTLRDTEYALFAQITHRLKALDESDKSAFPRLAAAVFDNQRLWGMLAEDLMVETNALPLVLRAQLISLSRFVRRHSMIVLSGRASIAPLVDINTAIMRGLRGGGEVAA